MKGACKASSCNLEIAQGSVTGNKDMSTDSEKASKSTGAATIIEAGIEAERYAWPGRAWVG